MSISLAAGAFGAGLVAALEVDARVDVDAAVLSWPGGGGFSEPVDLDSEKGGGGANFVRSVETLVWHRHGGFSPGVVPWLASHRSTVG